MKLLLYNNKDSHKPAVKYSAEQYFGLLTPVRKFMRQSGFFKIAPRGAAARSFF